MNRRVVVTGTGVITPVGNDVQTFWKNLLEGYCGIDFITSIPTDDLPVKIAGEVKDFNPADYGIETPFARKQDKFTIYAVAAAWQAVTQAGLVSGEDGNIDPFRYGVYVGSGIGGFSTQVRETEKILNEGAKWVSPLFIPTMIANIAAGNIAIRNNACGPCLPVVTACATSTHAIGEAYRAIKHGYADAIIAGGSEAAVIPLAIAGFANAKALSRAEDPKYASLPFNKNRGGFVLSEGAAMLVLEEYEHAVARGAEILAEICGYAPTEQVDSRAVYGIGADHGQCLATRHILYRTGLIGLVQHENARLVCRTDLSEDLVYGVDLILKIGGVALRYVEEQICLCSLFEGGFERLYQFVRQTADKTNGVHKQVFAAVRQLNIS